MLIRGMRRASSRRPRSTRPMLRAKWPTAACRFTAASASRGNMTCICTTGGPRPRRFSSATPATIGLNWPTWYLVLLDGEEAGERIDDDQRKAAGGVQVGDMVEESDPVFGARL